MSDILTNYRVDLVTEGKIISALIREAKSEAEAIAQAEAKFPEAKAVNAYEDHPVLLSDQELEALAQRNGSPGLSDESGNSDQPCAHTHEPDQTGSLEETRENE